MAFLVTEHDPLNKATNWNIRGIKHMTVNVDGGFNVLSPAVSLVPSNVAFSSPGGSGKRKYGNSALCTTGDTSYVSPVGARAGASVT